MAMATGTRAAAMERMAINSPRRCLAVSDGLHFCLDGGNATLLRPGTIPDTIYICSRSIFVAPPSPIDVVNWDRAERVRV